MNACKEAMQIMVINIQYDFSEMAGNTVLGSSVNGPTYMLANLVDPLLELRMEAKDMLVDDWVQRQIAPFL
ncbi:hypothetical protein L1987_71566 [Smallanthus sonchifolius]|uniref:Uncharacterized protein n=1 Tax=Smallanthus sonchifolius TaxID=185202 RepID=A0ACB9ATF4_9ASTR|nr:hypothetical protein L1987_71566 [Smallanthus sonchifolius]